MFLFVLPTSETKQIKCLKKRAPEYDYVCLPFSLSINKLWLQNWHSKVKVNLKDLSEQDLNKLKCLKQPSYLCYML